MIATLKRYLLIAASFGVLVSSTAALLPATASAEPGPGSTGQVGGSTDNGGAAGACALGGSFFGFPAWYKYLRGVQTDHGCVPELKRIADIWLIGLAVLEILIRLAGLLAIFFVLWGGIQLITSQGDPSGTKAARHTIANALIGLVIAVAATSIITFIAGRFN